MRQAYAVRLASTVATGDIADATPRTEFCPVMSDENVSAAVSYEGLEVGLCKVLAK
jgi:hypothetical protein